MDPLRKKKQLQSLRFRNFCQKHLLYHKASATDIYKMHKNNSALALNAVVQTIPDEEIKTAEHCEKYWKETCQIVHTL